MRERLRSSLGATAGSGTREQFNTMFPNELAKGGKVVKAASVRVD